MLNKCYRKWYNICNMEVVMEKYFSKDCDEALRDLQSDSINGLSDDKVKKNREVFGENKLVGGKKRTMFHMFFDQFKNFLLIILVIAGIISFIFGEYFEGFVILFVVVLNCILGVYQEYKASNALNALKEMSSPHAKVRRNGRIKEVLATEIVVGDIVILDAGDSICADLRLIETSSLKIDEAALTGESEHNEKDAKIVLNEDTVVGDMKNSAFMGTTVTYGRGAGVVYATGMNTQMGKIATLLNETKNELTPLQRKLDDLGKKLGIVCLIVCLVIFGLGIFRGMEFLELFMTSVSLAVAAIPEGLTIVVTVILAMGMKRMVKSNAIIKTLGAVETLGGTTVICSDKTGTLTQNKMTVVKVYDGEDYEASSYDPNQSMLVKGMALCSDARLDGENIIGDPTEGALVLFAKSYGIDAEELNEEFPRLNEYAFDSNRKLMSTIHKVDESNVMYTKGAFDCVLLKTKYIIDKGVRREITQNDITTIKNINEKYAKNALRVLALAFRECGSLNEEEDNLTFVGLVGMIDPPREEAKKAIKVCENASIDVKMITGDHKITAAAIAKQLGIIESDDEAIEGSELDMLSDLELKEVVKEKSVFARVSPEHKVRLVEVIKSNENVVAMTGDGVNDAPSLKKADIGIAMGITGTEVSKEASDMILTDDNFASIVKAVEEGRTIYNNIRKVVAYLLSCNVGEILIIFIAMLLGFPMPLGAIQLISINLITDTFPAFALGVEEKEEDVMNIPPRDTKESIVDKFMLKTIIFQSIALTIGALLSFIVAYKFIDPVIATTSCFITLVVGELLRGYSARFERRSVFKSNIFSNGYLNKTVLFSLVFLISTVYIPGLNTAFGMQAVSASTFLIAISFSIIPFIGGEISKKLK